MKKIKENLKKCRITTIMDYITKEEMYDKYEKNSSTSTSYDYIVNF